MPNRQSGFAVAVVMLFTLVTLALLVAALSITTNSSRDTTVRIRQQEQARMAAESGINTFISRLRETNFIGDRDTVQSWIASNKAKFNYQIATAGNYTGAADTSSAKVSLTIPNISETDETLTLKSTATLGSGANATKATVIQGITMYHPANMNVSPPAALTACTSIAGKGGSSAFGSVLTTTITDTTQKEYMSFDGTFSVNTKITTGVTVTSTTTWPVRIEVNDSTSFEKGSYVKINGYIYQIVGKVGKRLQLQPSEQGAPTTGGLEAGKSVRIVPFAIISTPITSPSNSSYVRIYIEDNSPFIATDTVYFTDPWNTASPSKSNSFVSTVMAKGTDAIGKYIDVIPGSTNPEVTTLFTVATADQLKTLKKGQPLVRFVSAAASANDIGGSNNSVREPIIQPRNTTLRNTCNKLTTDSNALFDSVFHMTKDDYKALATLTTADAISGKPMVPGLYYINSSANFGASDLCGTGILVIFGNLDMQGTGTQNGSICSNKPDGINPPDFNGIIYVTGYLKSSGNSIFHGAVVIEGSPVDISGTMNTYYDAGSVYRSAAALTPVVIYPTPGTWSQQ